MRTGWLDLMIAGVAVACAASQAVAVTVVVPTDELTIQAAVDAAGAGGTVIINSNDTFDETVRVTQSLTIHGGVGFHPTIRATDNCSAASCAVFFEPNSVAAQMLVVTDVRFMAKSGLVANTEVVRVLNRGSGEASMILSNFVIEGPEGTGYLAFNIGRLSCTSGLNTVSVQSGSIIITGADENSGGGGGFTMGQGGSLFVSDVDLSMNFISGTAFNIANTPDCGQIIFALSDSFVSVSSPTNGSVDLGNIIRGVTATLERNVFGMSSHGEGSAGGFFLGGGTGQTYNASVTLNRNRFFGSGPDRGIGVHVAPSANGSVMLTATNNVLHDMHTGFRLGQNLDNPAGTVVATLANNTVDGSLFDAISLTSAEGSTVTVTAKNNLLAHSAGWGISLTSQPGDSLTVISDYNGFFANEAGNVQAPLSVGPHDVVDDPLYVDRPDEDFRLGLGSPMINAGDNSLVSTAVDADGAMRVQGGTVDIGAFEGGFPVNGATNTPSGTPTASGTATPTPTRTATNTRTPTATATASLSATQMRTATPTVTGTPTRTSTRTATGTHTRTATTIVPTATHTRTTASLTVTRTPSGSVTPSATRSGTQTVAPPSPTSTPTTAVRSPTPTVTGSPVSTATTIATPTVGAGQCIGDCDGSNSVSVNELVLGVNIALARATLAACPPFDQNDSGGVEVNELVAAVNRALQGCNQSALMSRKVSRRGAEPAE